VNTFRDDIGQNSISEAREQCLEINMPTSACGVESSGVYSQIQAEETKGQFPAQTTLLD